MKGLHSSHRQTPYSIAVDRNELKLRRTLKRRDTEYPQNSIDGTAYIDTDSSSSVCLPSVSPSSRFLRLSTVNSLQNAAFDYPEKPFAPGAVTIAQFFFISSFFLPPIVVLDNVRSGSDVVFQLRYWSPVCLRPLRFASSSAIHRSVPVDVVCSQSIPDDDDVDDDDVDVDYGSAEQTAVAIRHPMSLSSALSVFSNKTRFRLIACNALFVYSRFAVS